MNKIKYIFKSLMARIRCEIYYREFLKREMGKDLNFHNGHGILGNIGRW